MNKKIAFIEDEQLIREGVAAIIEARSSHIIAYSCSSVEEFLSAYNLNSIPDIMLLDIGLPGISGINGIPNFLELIPDLDIIMFSTYEEDEKIYNALRAGACSYVSKRSSPEKVIDALNVVSVGGAYMSPAIARKVANYFISQNSKQSINLSDRHKEIIDFIIQGHSYKDIGEKIHISHNTVKTHVKRIYELLRINSKAGLLRKYYDGELN